jgi:hypothetical protein
MSLFTLLFYFPDFLGIFLGGFFIEAGSNDAETDSDSLHFELNRGWTVGNNKKTHLFNVNKYSKIANLQI